LHFAAGIWWLNGGRANVDKAKKELRKD